MSELPPEEGPAFEQMMRVIDDELAAQGTKIQGRGFRAIQLISQRYGVSIPVIMGHRPGPPNLERWADLSEKVHEWFADAYGDKMIIDGTPGRVVVELRGDLYVIVLPRIYGTFLPLVSRKFLDLPTIGRNAPVRINLVQAVEGLTEARAERLTDRDLQRIGQHFLEGLESCTVLESNADQSMIPLAQGDIETATAKLLDRGDRWGESKWASLQAAEKVLKTAITLEGNAFPHVHKLQSLIDLLKSPHLRARLTPLVPKLQCDAGIRYGSEICTRGEALDAHHTSLALVRELHRNGGVLKFSPKWRPVS